MSIFSHIVNQEEIVKQYFSDPEKKITLKKDEVLLRQNEDNHKIFYVAEGKLIGYLADNHLSEPIFEAAQDSFVGVYSYFSEHHKSYSQVVAAATSVVYYFDDDPRQLDSSDSEQFLSFLFNIVVLELRSRQHFAANMAHERHEAMNKLIKTEKLATLGQLSTGLAHELNNTIGSLSSNLGQMETDIKNLFLQKRTAKMNGFFVMGLEKGQQLSSSEARKARSKWPAKLGLTTPILKKLTRAGIKPEEIQSKEEAIEAATLWNLGHMLHDMKIAATQATHVTNSIRSMGIANQNWSKQVDVNKTISEAITILRNLTRDITLEVNLEVQLTPIEACHGELVQVWVNLIKNAVESLLHHKVKGAKISITSKETDRQIEVKIEDNGIGIDASIIDKIYEPNFTTKVAGLSLGLGLGLSIVQRIVSEHDGNVDVVSKKGQTYFEIRLSK